MKRGREIERERREGEAASRQKMGKSGQPLLCSKCENLVVDRISGMPNPLILEILSRIPLKDAGKTSVLSLRWKELWKHTNILNFNGRLEPDSSKFVGFVNTVLDLHKSTVLDEFVLTHHLSSDYIQFIDKWITFALQRCPKVVDIDFSTANNTFSLSHDFYVSFFGNPSNLFLYKRLTSVALKCVNVKGEFIEYLLTNCPMLENLSLVESEDVLSLNIVSSSLKYLEISICCNLENLKFSIPTLVSFTYIGYPIYWEIEDLSVLSKLSIGGALGDFGIQALEPFSSILSQLETLELQLQTEFLESEEIDVPKPLLNLKNLTLHFSRYECVDNGLNFLSPLLEAAPSLEKCTIQIK